MMVTPSPPHPGAQGTHLPIAGILILNVWLKHGAVLYFNFVAVKKCQFFCPALHSKGKHPLLSNLFLFLFPCILKYSAYVYLKQWLSTFLMLWPLSTVPCFVVTPAIKLFRLLLYNHNFVKNHNVNIWYATSVGVLAYGLRTTDLEPPGRGIPLLHVKQGVGCQTGKTKVLCPPALQIHRCPGRCGHV